VPIVPRGGTTCPVYCWLRQIDFAVVKDTYAKYLRLSLNIVDVQLC
jgi:hypothetical protein